MNALRWAGYWKEGQLYFPGEVIIYNRVVYIAREETTRMPITARAYEWVYIGRHEPHKPDHPWLPDKAAYPLPSGEISDATLLCSECWKTSNYVMSFKSEAHRYLIQEMP